MEIIYRVELVEFGIYSIKGKVMKSGKYIGWLNVSVNDTHSLKGNSTYDYCTRTDVDSVTFGLQMELKKFLIDKASKIKSNAKRKKKQSFGWTY